MFKLLFTLRNVTTITDHFRPTQMWSFGLCSVYAPRHLCLVTPPLILRGAAVKKSLRSIITQHKDTSIADQPTIKLAFKSVKGPDLNKRSVCKTVYKNENVQRLQPRLIENLQVDSYWANNPNREKACIFIALALLVKIKKITQQRRNPGLNPIASAIATGSYRGQNSPLTLKASSTITGFKKCMYSKALVSQSQLQPSYNRRKYSHSHYNQTLKEYSRLGRLYGYLSKQSVKNYSAFTNMPQSMDVNDGQSTQSSLLQLYYHRPIPRMIAFLESRLDVILWRNQLSSSTRNARQKLRQGLFTINGGLQSKSSYPCFPGDTFLVRSD